MWEVRSGWMAAPCRAGQGLQEVTAWVPRACVGRTTRREGEGKQTTVHFPMVVFGARPSQALVLGWRPRSPHGLTSSRGNWGFSFVKSIHWPGAVSHVFGEISKVQGPGTRPGREPAAPSPLQGQRSTDDTGSHPGCRGHVPPSCRPLAAFETFFF